MSAIPSINTLMATIEEYKTRLSRVVDENHKLKKEIAELKQQKR